MLGHTPLLATTQRCPTPVAAVSTCADTVQRSGGPERAGQGPEVGAAGGGQTLLGEVDTVQEVLLLLAKKRRWSKSSRPGFMRSTCLSTLPLPRAAQPQ